MDACPNCETLKRQAQINVQTIQIQVETIKRLSEEVKEYVWLTGRLSYLLTATANALKGKPKARHLHDWSDLPKVARKLKREESSDQKKSPTA